MKAKRIDPQAITAFARHAAQGGAAPMPQAVAELPAKLHHLASSVVDLENIVEEMEKRLQPIVRPMPPNGVAGVDGGCHAPSPQAFLSNEVEGLTGRLSFLRNRISDLLDSLAI